MSITIRCKACNRYYALKNGKCPQCGNPNHEKHYHIRYNSKAIYAGTSLTIAREMEAEMRKDKRLGRINAYNEGKDMPFAEFIDKYYEPHYMNRNKSANKMEYMVGFFREALKGKTLRAITPADIELIVTAKTIGRAPRTRDHYLAIIRRIFNYAVELELLERSPVKMKELKVDNTRHRFLSDDEAVRLLTECKKSQTKWLYPMVMIALHTGMRLGEIKSLKRENLIDGKIYLKSTHTKNSKVKIIPINDDLQVFIDEYLATHEDFDFNHECRMAYKNAIKRAGIEDFRFHDLRHTFASKLKAQNINDGIIQQLMGLETASMVQRYAHLSPESVLNAIKVVSYVK